MYKSGGRPQSAAGGRRSRAPRPSPTVVTASESANTLVNDEPTYGNTNHAFDGSDNEPEVEEIITNIPDRKNIEKVTTYIDNRKLNINIKQASSIKKVEVTSDRSNETIELITEDDPQIENNLEELHLDEPKDKQNEKPKKKKRKPKPEKTENVVKSPSPVLRREDTVLFPGFIAYCIL